MVPVLPAAGRVKPRLRAPAAGAVVEHAFHQMRDQIARVGGDDLLDLHRLAFDRQAAAVDDLLDRERLGAQAAVGEYRERLRDFERRHLGGAEHDRRVGRQAAS